ncbi:DUF4908 domain-containing protein [Hyphobacterium sp. HN65]|uniref:DUF4908 domain-containing protein n=1 Tax=Hyphobacterium lacteum TaxID=3116575 RepID=A0ABU7LQ02_9PROT|nr:DUF4908 domain-containing protein [Hyphobacterium sp. HN65]MEE2525994.1 DUF4908 domain-containing protein [Hyphobacterium sp. HN65]
MISRRFLLAAMLSGVASGIPAAWAGVDNPLRQRRSRREEVPDVAEFHRQDGRRGFVLDRTDDIWLLQPLDEEEVLALFPQRAPNGGTSFNTDWGDEIVRISSIGAVTYYPDDQPNGVIAEMWEPARSIQLPDASVDDLREASAQSALQLASIMGRPVQVEYGAAPREGLGLMVDAMRLAVTGIERARTMGAELDFLQRLKIAPGEMAELGIVDDLFTVRVNLQAGFAGRPSSTRISRYLTAYETPS